MFKNFIFFLFFLLVFGLVFANSQDKKTPYQNSGFKKYLKNYNHKDHVGLRSRLGSILQDKRGIIYVGAQGGVLEFDGVSWQLIKIPNNWVRSLAIDDTGTIYASGINEFGYLTPDSKGALQYVSLIGHLDENKKNFGAVLRVNVAKEGVYFTTRKFLFRWDNRKINVWRLEQKELYCNAFACKGNLFLYLAEKGLFQMVDESLNLVPGGETFASLPVTVMVPYDKKKMLIGTQSGSLYIFDGIKTVLFPTQADHYLKKKGLTNGIRLSSGDFALAVLRGGLVIIDAQGRIKEIFDRSYGLQDDEVHHVLEDSQGNLWLGLGVGISKIEYVFPISRYHDLPRYITSVTKHRDVLYAGTSGGLYSLASGGKFRLVPGMSNSCTSLLSTGNFLLTATSKGVFLVGNKNNIKIIMNSSQALLQSPKDANRIWVGTSTGLVSLYEKNGQWAEEHKFEQINRIVHNIIEDKKGNLWLDTFNKDTINFERKIFKIDFSSNGTISHPEVTEYDSSHGLPSQFAEIFSAAGHVLFSAEQGLFRFDEKNERFISDNTFGEEFVRGKKFVYRMAEDRNRNIWFSTPIENLQAIPQSNGAYVTRPIIPFFRLSPVSVYAIYPGDDGNTVWFARADGLIRYDTTVKKNYRQDFPILIRKVLANGKLVFGGYKTGPDSESQSGRFFPKISYRERNLSFEFAAPFFEDETGTQYQYRLDGYDNDWSDWGSSGKKEYTNLDPGLYTFRLKGKNVYQHLSNEAVFKFRVLLPWYRTWWAFLSYGFVLFMITYLVYKWRHSLQLEQEKQKLEQIVKERTREINEKNKQLEEQSDKLKEMDQVKSRFFANISHEFRTPLTLIMGPIEQLLSKTCDKEQEKKLNLMLRNSQRLLGLINQLLELSKLDSGNIKLQAGRQNIVPFLKGIAASFDLVATKNELDLIFHAEEETISLYFDERKLEEVIFNLLANAIKFTPPGGKITIRAAKNSTKETNFPLGWLEITVSDTGVGVPREQLAHIFDRFYQSESTYVHHQKGSGIGLAIARELVELHHGEIAAHSSDYENSGTEFIIRLPLGNSHLKPEEIVQPSGKEYQYKNLEEIPTFAMMGKKTGDPEGVNVSIMENEAETATQKKNIILVVEDNADVRGYIKSSLEPLYRVEEARDGKEGLERAKAIIPDLIISDIMMPGKDGYQLCGELKKLIDTSHIPIILLTAKASEESIVRGLGTGADDYITKPFSTKILCARIENLINLRRQSQFKRTGQMTLQPTEIMLTPGDEEFYQKLLKVIQQNLSDPELNVEGLGKKLNMSRITLYRKIMALTGESPQQFIRSYRLKRGAELLKQNSKTVLEVAFEVGFANSSYFAKCFKEKFHQLPSEYQEVNKT